MTEKDKPDPVADRRYALAAIVRSFAWPIVGFIALFQFSDTLDSFARDSQKISFAGVAIERFASGTNLSQAQIDQLKEFSSSEIMYFFSKYEEGTTNCEIAPLASQRDIIFIDAGLVVNQDGNSNCESDRIALTISSDGLRLRDAIGAIIAEAISRELK